jgi:adenylylsulfate kinase
MTRAASGVVVWISGLPSSGKSTLARAVKSRLDESRVASCLLDGDEVRSALRPSPGYDPDGRDAFYQTLIHFAVLLSTQGLVVLVAATASRSAYRESARELVPAYVEVEVSTPAAECERRDSKGLYAAARAGRIEHVPGLNAPYEPPTQPDVIANGGRDLDACENIVRRALQLRAK